MNELIGKMRAINQRLYQQPRLAREADVKSVMKTRKRTEGAEAGRAKHGNISSARIDGGPTSLTSFGMIVEPLLLALEKYIGDALVNKGTEAPKPHFPLSSAACSLMPPAQPLQ